MKKILCLTLLWVFSLLGTSCGKTPTTADIPTVTPTPISILYSHYENPHIRGTIVTIFSTEGIPNAVLVKGILEADTIFDQMLVGITESTQIFLQTEDGYQVVTPDQLAVDQNVEVLFVSDILESYPGQGDAGEILIIP